MGSREKPRAIAPYRIRSGSARRIATMTGAVAKNRNRDATATQDHCSNNSVLRLSDPIMADKDAAARRIDQIGGTQLGETSSAEGEEATNAATPTNTNTAYLAVNSHRGMTMTSRRCLSTSHRPPNNDVIHAKIDRRIRFHQGRGGSGAAFTVSRRVMSPIISRPSDRPGTCRRPVW